jgi:hypothetical protein
MQTLAQAPGSNPRHPAKLFRKTHVPLLLLNAIARRNLTGLVLELAAVSACGGELGKPIKHDADLPRRLDTG